MGYKWRYWIIQLADPLILRFDRKTGTALSLSILTFSQIIQVTELGPRSFQLYGLEALPKSLREMVVKMITTPPVSHFLKIVVYYPKTEQPPIPISYIEQSVALPLTAWWRRVVSKPYTQLPIRSANVW